MAKPSIEDIKRLRELTGVGITDAKKALEESGGDFEKAVEAMRVKGMAKADAKASREAKTGVIESYVHDHRIGVLVELNCETDFVARTDDFKRLARDLTLHIAASAPRFVSREDVSEEALAKEQDLIARELKEQGKPANMIEQITQGKLDKFYAEACLLEQPFVKDPDISVGELIKQYIARLGENIVVGRMARIELGRHD